MTGNIDFERGEAVLQQFIRGDALIGIMPDFEQSERDMLEAFWSAAQQGHAPAFLSLASCYGAALQPLGAFEGVQDDGSQRPWSKQALALTDDDPMLQATLRAYFEADRLGAPDAALSFARASRAASDEVQAVAEARLAAKTSPSADELYQLGLVQHWRANLEGSARTHHRAADAGSLDAKFELSLLYGQGLGVEPNPAEARKWLLEAADAGHPRALYNVGSSWATGSHDGVVDTAKAVQFYTRAAEAGHARAACTLAVMILTGEHQGTPDEAKRWLDRADEGGYPTYEMLDAAGVDDPRAS